MKKGHSSTTDVLILAVPETAGSALYGMVDVLSAAGNLWQTLTGQAESRRPFRVRVISDRVQPFSCGNGIPVTPECSIGQAPSADIIILPELWFAPDASFRGMYPHIMNWLRERHRRGCAIYSACSGALMLAESGLLDGCRATSHWGYQALFQRDYPQVEFTPEPNLVFADPAGHIVTAGGTTSWHDLALHIIARYADPGEALRIAKVYLLKWHGEGQLPFAPLVRRQPHADAVVRRAEDWLGEHYRQEGAIALLVSQNAVAERTLKRRFRNATGCSLIEYLQNLRVEAAKHLLESSDLAIDEISAEVGYEDASFFRRLFKRTTGMAPSEYRRMFRPVALS
ncbi:GlxA family transcriptional regulator [Marinobacterium sp. YM272]|uniref:GlxA family transcriptional regulator n=1 Tax=Marinobacterium sp. YM272 TaxID=3421654 RepID=UPI003D7F1AF5